MSGWIDAHGRFDTLRRVVRLALLATLACNGCGGIPEPEGPKRMSPGDVRGLPATPADARIPYGDAAMQFGELRLPGGPGPHPVAVLVHGGCWYSYLDLTIMDPLASALTEAGLATWNVEFRPADAEGGGWPETLLDVGRGADHLRVIGSRYDLDLDRVIAVGHSSGGQLALWLAARSRMPAGSGLSAADPLPVHAVAGLSAVNDLAAFAKPGKNVCGDDVVARLMGGSAARLPERYRLASPAELLPLGVPQLLVAGEDDRSVPPDHARAYADAARAAGDDVELLLLPAAGHFEPIAPSFETFDGVRREILALVPTTREP